MCQRSNRKKSRTSPFRSFPAISRQPLMGRYHLGAHGLLLQPLLWQDVNLQELWRGERGRISRLGEGLCLRQQGQGRPPQIWCHKHAKRNARKIESCETEKLDKKRPEQDEKGHKQCHPSFRCSSFTSLKLLQPPRIGMIYTKSSPHSSKVFHILFQLPLWFSANNSLSTVQVMVSFTTP